MSADFRQGAEPDDNVVGDGSDKDANSFENDKPNPFTNDQNSIITFKGIQGGLKALAQTLPELSVPNMNASYFPTVPQQYPGGIVSGDEFKTPATVIHNNENTLGKGGSRLTPFGTTLPTMVLEIATNFSEGNCTSMLDCFNNSTQRNQTSSINENSEKQFWALIILLFPMLTMFGNGLVIVSVYKERSLRTVTNFLIVSLATADLLVATIVMPFYVYYMVSY